MRFSHRVSQGVTLGLCSLLLWLPAAPALAQTAPAPTPSGADSAGSERDPSAAKARESFLAGAKLAADLRWREALERFEASAKLRPHPGTTYNIAICQRALGQYTRARVSFERVLEEAKTEALDQSLLDDTRAILAELRRVLARVTLTLKPKSAKLSIDGRPLRRGENGGFVAGLREPGPPEAPGKSSLKITLDPGPHLLLISRKGYADYVKRLNLRPGGKLALELELSKLPANLKVQSNRTRAAVSIDGIDVGTAPISLSRPAGTYRVQVQEQGFQPYVTETRLRSGEQVTLRAVLDPETVALSERWWFWAGIGVLAVGIGVTTYALTRPDPERPPLNGGSLGWTVEVP
ncbi:MAG: PEGA domain-containing protein [Polyangiaceae bacterium]|nr:PEGA domain-containing protein [Polyangiaceae bacterium]MCB9607904.1 PEGA domain-containing protein [Polyangiaceae bacterium]